MNREELLSPVLFLALMGYLVGSYHPSPENTGLIFGMFIVPFFIGGLLLSYLNNNETPAKIVSLGCFIFTLVFLIASNL